MIIQNGADGPSVRPCGACSALVPASSGCRHWRPDKIASNKLPSQRRAPRKATVKPPEKRPLSNEIAMNRLRDGSAQRALLAAAYDSPEGRIHPYSGDRRRQVANRLVVNGLMILLKRGGSYEITDEGRRTHERIVELDGKA